MVDTLVQLHALSESLDSEMARHFGRDTIDAGAYISAWQSTGRVADREQQIALTLVVGRSLDELTRKPLLRHSLRMMRGPARASGLAALQQFLESGFDTFLAMRGATDFLATVGMREQSLAAALFAANALGGAGAFTKALGQLP